MCSVYTYKLYELSTFTTDFSITTLRANTRRQYMNLFVYSLI